MIDEFTGGLVNIRKILLIRINQFIHLFHKQTFMFNDKTVVVTGGSRGIGKAIAIRLAKEKANIVIAAKSVEEDPRLGGTIFSAAIEVEEAGGRALAVQCDIRSEEQIRQMIRKAVDKFGTIDILVNNASAISLTPT